MLHVVMLGATFSIEMVRVSMITIIILNTTFIIILLSVVMLNLVVLRVNIIDIESLKNRLLKVCYVPATSARLPKLLFLLQPLTVLMKQTRQAVQSVKRYLDVYGQYSESRGIIGCTTTFGQLKQSSVLVTD